MSGKLKPDSILISTLGTEPQVVTSVVDLLLRDGEAIHQVLVLHTTAPGTPLAKAVEVLKREFSSFYAGKNITFNMLALQDERGKPLIDLDTPVAASSAFRMLYKEVRQAKLDGYRVHLSISGGRKTLAVFGMAAAQMLFEEGDRLWHLFSAGDFLESKRLHPALGDQVHLVSIPFIPWSQVSPVFGGLSGIDDPYQAAERLKQLKLDQQMEASRTFVLGSLTPAERRVVELLVREGLGDAEIGNRLALSPRTVEQHLRSAYLKASNHWELESISRTQLVALLSLYYSLSN